jgi:uncharacterized protein YukE
MYLGRGAKFMDKDRPNRMAQLNMDCNVCHTKDTSASASCKDCHGDLTDGMTERWKKIMKEGQGELAKAISEARAVEEKKRSGAMKEVIGDAQYNYEFIKKGLGVHNIIYAVEVIEATKKALRPGVTRPTVGQAKAAGAAKPEVSCAVICHGQIADKKVKFGTVNFPHGVHIEGEGSCLECHSSYAQHGKTHLEGCSGCHHGKGAGRVKCTDCHRAEEAMFKGKGVKDIPVTPNSNHGEVDCTECHGAVKKGKKSDIADVKANCARCHDEGYAAVVDEWTASHKKLQEKYSTTIAGLEKEMTALEEKERTHSVPLRGFYDEINRDMQLILQGRWAHNPQYGEATERKVEKKSQALQSMIEKRKQGKPVILK